MTVDNGPLAMIAAEILRCQVEPGTRVFGTILARDIVRLAAGYKDLSAELNGLSV